MMHIQFNRPALARDNWDVRCGVFWMNDQELLRDSDADLARKAAAFRENGCNWVLTFSCTHFRWSFYHYWDLINAALRRIVAACHDQGIRVIEHHSAVLTHAPRDEQGLAWLERCLNIRKSSVKTWPDMIGGYDRDPALIDGKKLTDFYYIDGRSGAPLYSGYHGYAICPNNPFYRRAYLQYLETVYATGVDGIMTDDVSYSFYACACEFCRRDFTELTGRKIPPAGPEFAKWHGNWDDPVFRAWIDFRRAAVEKFHQAVKRHYESLGLQLYRPNYERIGLQQHRDAYCLQHLPALDLIWQEAGGAHILDYSWPPWAVEAAQRFAIGRCRGIPSALFAYPTRKNQLILAWALAMSWGQGFTGTGEGYVAGCGEGLLRAFEIKHAKYLRRVLKFATLAFYDSRLSRNHTFEYEKEPRNRLLGWALACYMANLPFDILETEELRARLGCYQVVVVREIRFMADWEISAFRQFMENGGTVLWAGDAAARRPDWTERPAAELAAALGAPDFRFPARDAPPALHSVGRGRLAVCGEACLMPDYEREHQLNWWNNDLHAKPTVPFRRLADQDKIIRKKLVGYLTELLSGGLALTAENLPEGVLATAFLTESAAAAVVHLVNAAGILDKPDGAPAGFDDVNAIGFPSHAGRPPFVLTLRLPADACLPAAPGALYHNPGSPEPAPLAVEELPQAGGRVLRLTVPADRLQAYGMVTVG